MKKILIGCAVLIALVFGFSSAQNKTLRLFIWSEYIDSALIKAFEKKEGVRVNASYYESNEDMLAKLKQGGTKQYDIVVPSGYIIPSMLRQTLLRPLDKTLIPNFKNLGVKFISPDFDKGGYYTAAYFWGTTGIGYRMDKLPKNFRKSWGIYFDPKKVPGPIQLLDDMRPTIGAALKYLGKSYNSTNAQDLKAALDVLRAAKTKSVGFGGSVDAKQKLLSGQIVMAIMYNAEAVRASEEDPRIGYFVPEEGAEIWVDCLAIPKDAPNWQLAHKFINFMLDAKNAAQNANNTQNSTPVDAARVFIDKKRLANPAIYPNPTTLATLEYTLDLGSAQRLYDAVWTQLKAR
ncbi:MAG: spermidine/putrescine ABC transporter substrate-binding protein [Deinococcales bacterium]